VGRAGLVGGPRAIGAALTFGAQVLLARWMGAEQLGTYVLVFALCTVGALVCSLGLPSAAPRFIAEAMARAQPGLLSGFLRRSRQITFAAAAILALLGLVVWLIEAPAGQERLAFAAAFMLPLMAYIRLQVMLDLSLARTAQAFVPEFILRPALFLVVLTGVWTLMASLSAVSALWAQAVAVAAAAFVQWTVFRSAPERSLAAATPRYATDKWLITAVPLLTVDLFTSYFAEINLLAFGALASTDEVAVLHVAFRIAMLIGFGVHAIEAAILPSTARYQANGDTGALRRSIAEANTVRLCGGAAAVLIMIAAGHFLLGLFGQSFRSGYPTLVLLLIAQMIGVLAGPTAQLLSVSGGERDCARAVALSLAATCLVQLVLVPRFGLGGAAAAVLTGTAVWHGSLLWLANRRLGFMPVGLLWPTFRPS